MRSSVVVNSQGPQSHPPAAAAQRRVGIPHGLIDRLCALENHLHLAPPPGTGPLTRPSPRPAHAPYSDVRSIALAVPLDVYAAVKRLEDRLLAVETAVAKAVESPTVAPDLKPLLVPRWRRPRPISPPPPTPTLTCTTPNALRPDVLLPVACPMPPRQAALTMAPPPVASWMLLSAHTQPSAAGPGSAPAPASAARSKSGHKGGGAKRARPAGERGTNMSTHLGSGSLLLRRNRTEVSGRRPAEPHPFLRRLTRGPSSPARQRVGTRMRTRPARCRAWTLSAAGSTRRARARPPPPRPRRELVTTNIFYRGWLHAGGMQGYPP